MEARRSPVEPAALEAFVDLVGRSLWRERLSGLRNQAARGGRAGRALIQQHAIEFALERLRGGMARAPNPAEHRVAAIAADAARLADGLNAAGRKRLRTLLRGATRGSGTLVPAFHLLRTAARQQARGFDVAFAGIEEGAPFDLLIARDGAEAEIACDLVSAEAGRGVHRGAWFRLADQVDPDLQTWLEAHPGRYLLKITLPQGLRGGLCADADGADALAGLHARIRAMLAEHRRADHDEAVVLRLDPLLLAAAQADELGLMSALRREFGPEAHLSVTAAGGGLFVMAVRAGRENTVAAAVRERLAGAAMRLTGARPGILAVFVEDTDREEWRGLRESLALESETRHFLTMPEARSVVAVSCASRFELFGLAPPDAAEGGELRFRNPSHPAARSAGLLPAVSTSS